MSTVTINNLYILSCIISELTGIDHKIKQGTGGYILAQEYNTHFDDVLYTGYVPKKELYQIMQAYIKGLKFKNNIGE